MTVDKKRLVELRERVEKATGLDRRLDADLAELAGVVPAWCIVRRDYLWTDGRPGLGAREWMAPTYTASIDAALALVERVLPGKVWCVRTEVYPTEGSSVAEMRFVGGGMTDRISAPTQPLAILSALLRALAEADAGQEGGT